jgi:hypothetical protein
VQATKVRHRSALSIHIQTIDNLERPMRFIILQFYLFACYSCVMAKTRSLDNLRSKQVTTSLAASAQVLKPIHTDTKAWRRKHGLKDMPQIVKVEIVSAPTGPNPVIDNQTIAKGIPKYKGRYTLVRKLTLETGEKLIAPTDPKVYWQAVENERKQQFGLKNDVEGVITRGGKPCAETAVKMMNVLQHQNPQISAKAQKDFQRDWIVYDLN